MTKYDDGGISFNIGERTLYFSKNDVERLQEKSLVFKNVNGKMRFRDIGHLQTSVLHEIAKDEGFTLNSENYILDWKPKASCANYERDNVETDLNPYSPTAKWINSENVVFKGHRDAEKWKPNKKDLIVEAVREDLLKRSQVGIKKYGTTLADNPLELKQWLQHAYEECLDQANYLKSAILKLKENEKSN